MASINAILYVLCCAVLCSHSHLSHVVNNKLPSSWVIHTWSLKFSNSKQVFEFIGHPKDDIANFCLHESPCNKPHQLYWMLQYPNLKCYPHMYPWQRTQLCTLMVHQARTKIPHQDGLPILPAYICPFPMDDIHPLE